MVAASQIRGREFLPHGEEEGRVTVIDTRCDATGRPTDILMRDANGICEWVDYASFADAYAQAKPLLPAQTRLRYAKAARAGIIAEKRYEK